MTHIQQYGVSVITIGSRQYQDAGGQTRTATVLTITDNNEQRLVLDLHHAEEGCTVSTVPVDMEPPTQLAE